MTLFTLFILLPTREGDCLNSTYSGEMRGSFSMIIYNNYARNSHLIQSKTNSVDIELGARLVNVATFLHILGHQQIGNHGMVVGSWRQRKQWESGEGEGYSPEWLSFWTMLERGICVMRNNYVTQKCFLFLFFNDQSGVDTNWLQRRIKKEK